MKKTDYINHVRLEVLSKEENVLFVCYAMARFLENFNLPRETTNEFLTAIQEAVANSVVHAYPDSIGIITIIATATKNKINVVIKDNGVGITDVKKALEPLYSTANSERSGMGFTIMQTFAPNFKVKSTPGKGTTVVLTNEVK